MWLVELIVPQSNQDAFVSAFKMMCLVHNATRFEAAESSVQRVSKDGMIDPAVSITKYVDESR